MARLNEAQKHELCRLLAERVTPYEIIAHFQKKYKTTISDRQIWSYKTGTFSSKAKKQEQWPKLIAELRQKWEAKLDDVSIASKRYRCEKLQTGLGKILNVLDIETGVKEAADLVKLTRALKDLLEQARKETEGDKVSVDGDLVVKIVRFSEEDGNDNSTE